MKKKLLVILLALTLVFGMFAGLAMSVSAEGALAEVYYEDFENGLGDWTNSVGTAVIDSNYTHSGNGALSMQNVTQAYLSPGLTAAKSHQLFTETTGTYYISMWVMHTIRPEIGTNLQVQSASMCPKIRQAVQYNFPVGTNETNRMLFGQWRNFVFAMDAETLTSKLAENAALFLCFDTTNNPTYTLNMYFDQIVIWHSSVGDDTMAFDSTQFFGSSDTTKGTVSVDKATVFPGSKVTLSASPVAGNEFLGWVDSDGKWLSSEENFTFKWSGKSVTARFEVDKTIFPYTVNGDVEDGLTNWGSFSAGTVELAAGAGVDGSNAVKFTATNVASSLVWDVGKYIINDPANGYYGNGAGTYTFTFKMKTDAATSQKFYLGAVHSSGFWKSGGRVDGGSGNAITVPSGDAYTTVVQSVVIDQSVLDVLKANGIASGAYNLGFRLDGSPSGCAFKGLTENYPAYYVDDASVMFSNPIAATTPVEAIDPTASCWTATFKSTGQIYASDLGKTFVNADYTKFHVTIKNVYGVTLYVAPTLMGKTSVGWSRYNFANPEASSTSEYTAHKQALAPGASYTWDYDLAATVRGVAITGFSSYICVSTSSSMSSPIPDGVGLVFSDVIGSQVVSTKYVTITNGESYVPPAAKDKLVTTSGDPTYYHADLELMMVNSDFSKVHVTYTNNTDTAYYMAPLLFGRAKIAGRWTRYNFANPSASSDSEYIADLRRLAPGESYTWDYTLPETVTIGGTTVNMDAATWKTGFYISRNASLSEHVPAGTTFIASDLDPYTCGTAVNNTYNTIADAPALIEGMVRITSENQAQGTVSTANNLAALRVGDNVTISATPKPGFVFDGWYSSADTLVSSNANLSVPVAEKPFDYVAKFVPFVPVLNVAPSDNVTFTLTEGGEGASALPGITDKALVYGQSYTLTAILPDGYEFLGWKNVGLSYTMNPNASMTFVAYNDMNLEALVASDSSALTVIYKDFTGAVIDQVYTDPQIPTTWAARFGYERAGWLIDDVVYSDGEALEALDDAFRTMTSGTVTVTPNYEKATAITYTVSVSGTGVPETVSDLEVLSIFSAVAPATNSEDKAFSYWKNAAGEILSYDTTYSFYVTADTGVYAVYGEAVGEGLKATLVITQTTNDGTSLSFVAERYVDPELATVVSHGLLLATGRVDSDELILNGVGVQKASATKVSNYGTFVGTKHSATGVYSARAYMVYQLESTGELVTVYSGIKTVTM